MPKKEPIVSETIWEFILCNWTIAELKRQCKDCGLQMAGVKRVLIDRICKNLGRRELFQVTEETRERIAGEPLFGLFKHRVKMGRRAYLRLFSREPFEALRWHEKLVVQALTDGPKKKAEIVGTPIFRTIFKLLDRNEQAHRCFCDIVFRWNRNATIFQKTLLLDRKSLKWSVNDEFLAYLRRYCKASPRKLFNTAMSDRHFPERVKTAARRKGNRMSQILRVPAVTVWTDVSPRSDQQFVYPRFSRKKPVRIGSR